MVGDFVLQPRTIVVMIIYMIMVYSLVYVFANDEIGVDASPVPRGLSNKYIYDFPDNSTSDERKDLFYASHGGLSKKEWRWEIDPIPAAALMFIPGSFLVIPSTVDAFGDYYLVFNDGFVMSVEEYNSDIRDWSPDGYGKGNWMTRVGMFFSSAINAFNVFMDLLTFGIFSPVGNLGFFSIIPFLMVLPVWVAITFWVLPYCISAIHAIGNLIPFT